MWGILSIISLIAIIAFAIMIYMSTSKTNMRNFSIGMLIVSILSLLLSGTMWYRNKKLLDSSDNSEPIDSTESSE